MLVLLIRAHKVPGNPNSFNVLNANCQYFISSFFLFCNIAFGLDIDIEPYFTLSVISSRTEIAFSILLLIFM